MGISLVYGERPVAVVFWYDQFYTVPAKIVRSQNSGSDYLSRFGDNYPALVIVEKPETKKEARAIIEKMENESIPPHHQIERYQPIAGHSKEIFRHEIDIIEVVDKNTVMSDQLNNVLSSTGTKIEDNHYIPLASKYGNIILIFDDNLTLLGFLNAPLFSSDTETQSRDL